MQILFIFWRGRGQGFLSKVGGAYIRWGVNYESKHDNYININELNDKRTDC